MIRRLAGILLASLVAGAASAQSGPAQWTLVMDHPNFVTVFARVAPARVAGVAERDVLLVYPAAINFLDHGRSRWSIDCGNRRMKRQGGTYVRLDGSTSVWADDADWITLSSEGSAEWAVFAATCTAAASAPTRTYASAEEAILAFRNGSLQATNPPASAAPAAGLSAPAAAEEWHAVYIASDALFAIDGRSLNADGDVSIAFVTTPTDVLWRSVRVAARYDCQTGAVQIGTAQVDPATFEQAAELSALLNEYASSAAVGDVACKRFPLTAFGFRSLDQLAWFARLDREKFVTQEHFDAAIAKYYGVLSMDPYNWWFVDMTTKSGDDRSGVVDYYTVWPGREANEDLYSIAETEIDCVARRTRTLRVSTGTLESEGEFRPAANTAWRGLDNHHDQRLVDIFCNGAMVPFQVFALDGAMLQTAVHTLPRAFYGR